MRSPPTHGSQAPALSVNRRTTSDRKKRVSPRNEMHILTPATPLTIPRREAERWRSNHRSTIPLGGKIGSNPDSFYPTQTNQKCKPKIDTQRNHLFTYSVNPPLLFRPLVAPRFTVLFPLPKLFRQHLGSRQFCPESNGTLFQRGRYDAKHAIVTKDRGTLQANSKIPRLRGILTVDTCR
jgi:hypothetical protein